MSAERYRGEPVGPENGGRDKIDYYNDRIHLKYLKAHGHVRNEEEGRRIVDSSLEKLDSMPLRRYLPGEEIYHEGDDAESLIVLRGGAAMGLFESERGLRSVEQVVFGLSVLGDEGLVEGSRKRGTTLQALVECSAHMVNYDALRKMAYVNGEIAVFTQNALDINKDGIVERGRRYMGLPANARVGAAIMEIDDILGKVSPKCVSHELIAQLASCTREYACRTIQKLRKGRIIGPQVNGKAPGINNRRGLINYIERSSDTGKRSSHHGW